MKDFTLFLNYIPTKMSIDNVSHYSWNKLPNNILRNIFYYVTHSGTYWLQDNTSLLYYYQLVCKEWNEMAQEALYGEVYLGSNSLKFISTVLNKESLGSLVKKIIFLEDFSRYGNAHELLQVIINICPNIQEMYAFQETIRSVVWTYLSSAKNVPQHLKLFTTKTSNAASIPLYSYIAIRFEKTLTQLQLCMSSAFINNAEQGFHRILSRRLMHFTSLKQLRIEQWKVTKIHDLDQLLNSCSQTVCELSFIYLDLSKCDFTSWGTIKQNTIIERLNICLSKIPASMLVYITYKLENLKSFDLTYIKHPDGLEQEINEWWDFLGRLCLKLKSYNISLIHSNSRDRHQLKSCINFSIQATQSKYIKNKGFGITLKKSQDGENMTTLTKNWNTYTVFLEFDELLYIDSILEWVYLYSPNKIHVKVESIEDHYKMLTETNPIQRQLSSTVARWRLVELCSKDNTFIFFRIISVVSQINNANVHFDRIVLCDERSFIASAHSLQISELRFTKSIIHHNVLNYISKVFTKIDTLIFDTCCILMDDQFHIKAFLPTTEMVNLELRVNPFVNVTNWPSCKKIKCENSSLENLGLLRAVSEEGHFMIKVETDDKTYIFYKQGSNGMTDWDIKPENVIGNSYNFVIWIKCKQLNEIKIVGESGLVWVVKLD